MIEKLKLGAVIVVSMVLGGMVVVGMNSLGSDSPSDNGSAPAAQATVVMPTPEADNGEAENDRQAPTAWEPVISFEELAAYVDSLSVGDVLEVTVVRGGEETTVDVVLEAWQAS